MDSGFGHALRTIAAATNAMEPALLTHSDIILLSITGVAAAQHRDDLALASRLRRTSAHSLAG